MTFNFSHKTVFELEKKRLIEEKKEYIEARKYKNEQTRCIIESIENMYKNKLDLLREKQVNDQNERILVQRAQKKVSPFYIQIKIFKSCLEISKKSLKKIKPERLRL